MNEPLGPIVEVSNQEGHISNGEKEQGREVMGIVEEYHLLDWFAAHSEDEVYILTYAVVGKKVVGPIVE